MSDSTLIFAQVAFTFPENYPIKAPEVKFITKVKYFHICSLKRQH
jgi:ubiquitin-protein ligase